jgi:ubiquinone/menaquinone biosynthesis C-methylase UbiE
MLAGVDEQDHWNRIYDRHDAARVSWYRPHLERSLELVELAQLPANASILDVGGGASTFVDDLLDHGFTRITVLDISAKALETARKRLGPRSEAVTWRVGDITRVELPEHGFDFWHDRAVFHFLVDAEARRRYVVAARRALSPGGHIVVAAFGPSGPERCSGLDVMRFGEDELHGHFGPDFRKLSGFTDVHQTPDGVEQEFVYCYCRLAGGS